MNAEWHSGMPVVLLKRDDGKTLSKIPLDADPDTVPDGLGALMWVMVKFLRGDFD